MTAENPPEKLQAIKYTCSLNKIQLYWFSGLSTAVFSKMDQNLDYSEFESSQVKGVQKPLLNQLDVTLCNVVADGKYSIHRTSELTNLFVLL